MSTHFYKVEFECDCGVDYGNCGAKCAIILKDHSTVDVYTLFQTDSHAYRGNKNKPKTTEGVDSCFGNAYHKALIDVLSLMEENPKTITEDEWKVILSPHHERHHL